MIGSIQIIVNLLVVNLFYSQISGSFQIIVNLLVVNLLYSQISVSMWLLQVSIWINSSIFE